jgi:hypothetical protein
MSMKLILIHHEILILDISKIYRPLCRCTTIRSITFRLPIIDALRKVVLVLLYQNICAELVVVFV